MKKSLLILFLIMITSCQTEKEINEFHPNNRIIKSSSKFITEDGPHIDDEFGSTQKFEKHYLKIEYRKDTIYARTVQSVNACGNAQAQLVVIGDTIILTTKEISEELCTSTDWYFYEYWISNPENKKYIISQE